MSSIKSYLQILKSSSIMGGAAGINLLLSMVRVKFAAVLIGTVGVGLIASFSALIGVVGSLAGLGLQTSGVRAISAEMTKGDDVAVGQAVFTLRRLSWFTGLVGMISMMLFSPLLSQLTFGHDRYKLDIAALGLIILLGNISGGQMALIQSMRRIGDMARANIYGAAAGTAVAIAFYQLLGMRGIVPTLVIVSAIQLILSNHFVRRIDVLKVNMTWKQTIVASRSMFQLGLVMMLNGVMASIGSYLTISLVTQYEGIQAVGIFNAAFALSGVFVNFVLGAMGADYFPRLTGVAHNNNEMVKLVNEQTEVGLLLALPGLLITMALAPYALKFFYTQEFLGAVGLLQWFLLGCLCRVISWPLGYVMLSLSNVRFFLITETSFHFLHIALIAFGIHTFGLVGVSIAFLTLYICYTTVVYLIGKHLINFYWTFQSAKLIVFSILASVLSFLLARELPLSQATFICLLIATVVSILCVRGIVIRTGFEHSMIRFASIINRK